MYSGSLVAIVTPMRPDGSVDFAAWTRLLDFHLENGTRGVVVAGTTGESATLTDSELHELVKRAGEYVRGRMLVVAGAGTSSTAQTVARARSLSELPIDALLVVTPAYVRPTQEGLFLHYSAVAAASRLPVILYNVPTRTAVDMLPETVARLAQVRNIAGIKEAVPDVTRVRTLCESCDEKFVVLSGDDASARETMLAGARGVISVTANVAPRAMADMVAAAIAGDRAAAERIDVPLAALHRDLFLEGNPIPAKWALRQMGLIESGIRLPLTELSVGYHSRLAEDLRAAGVLK
jgi:4-hydroxy-tetrahydrodipicolinate synthase